MGSPQNRGCIHFLASAISAMLSLQIGCSSQCTRKINAATLSGAAEKSCQRSPPFRSADELVEQLIVGFTTHALVLGAHVEGALQKLLIVSPCTHIS